ncbi:MAG: DUF2939 domain-containing protein [Hyphomicrobium sp.]|uniref:DUF2939 domain-containing protein n=1 Tax=Hyphomicrobium sp. TaxID=82 RepID=UPI00356780A3
MKKPLWIIAGLIALVAVAYIGAPFLTAWNIREAVRNGNSAYLTTAIEWPSVRETLKPSIARIALDLPTGEQTEPANPSLWQRAKAYWGQGAINSLVESYVTPEGLPQLFTAQKAYRDYVSGDDGTNALPILERISRAWARVKRAEFTGFTTFEIDMADKNDPSRLYLGKLQLSRVGWKLTELRLKFLNPANAAMQNFAGTF